MQGADQVGERNRASRERKRGGRNRMMEAERRPAARLRRARARRGHDHHAQESCKARVHDEIQCLTLNGTVAIRQEHVLFFDPASRMSRTIAVLYRLLYAGLLSRLPESAAISLVQGLLRRLPLDRLGVVRLLEPRPAITLGGVGPPNP